MMRSPLPFVALFAGFLLLVAAVVMEAREQTQSGKLFPQHVGSRAP